LIKSNFCWAKNQTNLFIDEFSRLFNFGNKLVHKPSQLGHCCMTETAPILLTTVPSTEHALSLTAERSIGKDRKMFPTWIPPPTASLDGTCTFPTPFYATQIAL